MLDAIIKILSAINRRITGLLAMLATACLFLMLSLILANVFARFVLDSGIGWSIEASRFLMVWMAVLYFPTAHRQQLNVAVDFAISPFKGTRLLQIFQILIELLICLTLFGASYYALAMTIRAENTTSLALGLPMPLVYSVLPAGFLLTGLCAVERVLVLVQGMLTPLYDGEEKSPNCTSPRV